MGEFTHNHYVPDWYQQRFLLPGQGQYNYLDLKPDKIVTPNGHTYTRKDLLKWGPKSCFAQDDLYATHWGSLKNTDIEKFFFGKIDADGQKALEFFDNFELKNGMHEAFQDLILYLSIQKLRTPKGLGFISRSLNIEKRNEVMIRLQQIRAMYCATWVDAIWQIADASQSDTKFIISDHPVTVYNRGCFPGSTYCRGFNDPDIRQVATHTYFPLSLDKILILTNLSWVRNPYQNENNSHPNKTLFRNAMFKATNIQIGRVLTEEEVLQINYITKKRALRYIAGAERNWLYPEDRLTSTHWNSFGDGMLFMPEPRAIHLGGEIVIGYKDGSSEVYGEYGHRPGQKGYKDRNREKREAKSLERFKSEFALIQGKNWRGWPLSHFGQAGPRVDSDEMFQYYISNVKDPILLRKSRNRTVN
jgi:hypothetical protein